MIRSGSTAAALLFALSAQCVQAATIEGALYAGTGGVTSPSAPQLDIIVNKDWRTETDSNFSISEQGAATGPFGSGSFSANLSSDTTTGEIKADLRVSRSGAPSDGSTSPIPSIFTWLSVAEQFLLTGTGTFTVYALVDAAWSLPSQGAFQFNLRTWSAFNSYVMGSDDFFVDTSGTPETVAGGQHDSFSRDGSVTDRLLVASVDIWNADNSLQDFDFTFSASIATWSSAAYLDAAHTATFMFATTGDLIATPVTPGFLSNPAIFEPTPGATPVPLPAAAPMAISGLAALFGLRRMKRRSN